MPRIRVLVVYQHLPHYRYGVFKALEALPGSSYEFAAGRASRDGSIPTVPCDRLMSFRPLRNVWLGRALWQSGLVALAWRGKYDAIVFLGDVAYLSTWVAAITARLKGRAVLFWTIGWHREEKGVIKHVRLAFYALANKLLLYGKVAQGIGGCLGYPGHKMSVIGNSHEPLPSDTGLSSADLERFLVALPRRSARVVGAVVRLNSVKRLDYLIQAAAVLNARGGNIVVLLVGSGPDQSRLQSLASELGVHAVFTGAAYSREQLELVYDRMAVTVVPVNAGLTALQSMRYGRPVITNDDPFRQAPESECIISGRTGSFYQDSSIDDLADKIEFWLERMRTSPDEVAARCRTEIETRWSANAQAYKINHEVLSALRIDMAR